MNEENKREIKQIINATLADLARQSKDSEHARETVTLDQQAVGRLSRMDALQQQAMAKATEARRKSQKTMLDDALMRLEGDDFGYCDDCGEHIPMLRLRINPCVRKCIQCQ